MSAAELKAYIDKVLGNSIRCLLPSYWWKRLFGLVVDKVDEVEVSIQKVEKKIPEIITSSLAEFAEKYPDIESRTFYIEGNQEKNAALYIKLIEEWTSKGIIGPVYLANLFTYSDGMYAIISPQFGGFLANGFSFYDVVLPVQEEGSPYGSAKKRDIIIKQDGSVEIKPTSFVSPFDASLSETSYYPLPNYIITKYLWNRVAIVELSSTAHPLNKEIYSRLNRGLYVPLVICADGTAFRDSAYYQVVATDDKGSTMRLWAFLYDVGDDYNHKYIIVDLDSEGITTVVEEGERNTSEGTSYDDTELRNSLNLVTERVDDLESEMGDKYTKPSSGIPISDLDSAVQSSLGKADTAIQKIKTINGQSIEGEGNIEISGGGSYDDTEIREEIALLTNEIINNEEVHAAALNDLNSRINELSENVSGATVTKEEFDTTIDSINNVIVENEEVHAAALNDLNSRINALAENVQGETITKSEFNSVINAINAMIIENEEVHAAALNDLNARIVAIETSILS